MKARKSGSMEEKAHGPGGGGDTDATDFCFLYEIMNCKCMHRFLFYCKLELLVSRRFEAYAVTA